MPCEGCIRWCRRSRRWVGERSSPVNPSTSPTCGSDPTYVLPSLQDAGLRSVLSVPMLRDGLPVGIIIVHTWETPRPFTRTQIDLLKTFADQAVIAIQNVRLFTELEARNTT